jgi:hypothetical protein
MSGGLESGSRGSADSRDAYERYIATLREGRPFHSEPILLGERRQVHDGRHRLFAAFAWSANRPDLVVDVFWNRILRVPRPLSASELTKYPIADGIVTADDPSDRRDYNCHGFSVGVRARLTTNDGPTFMKDMAYTQREFGELQDNDDVVALFDNPNTNERWHTAKRLRGRRPPRVYESKCGWEITSEGLPKGGLVSQLLPSLKDPPDGLRIVHPLEAISDLYGVLHSFWVRDSTREGLEKRRAYLRQEFGLDRFETIDDSSSLADELTRVHGLLRPGTAE